jgi:hypothetical protein
VGYVNAGTLPDKNWDLEAFGYNTATNSLVYIGGYNPMVVHQADGQNFPLGDIFISTGPPVTQPSGLKPQTDYPSSDFGYTYAIHFNTGGTYTIYKLGTTTTLETVYFSQTIDSGPYAVASLGNGSVVASDVPFTVSTDTGGVVNTLLGENLFTTTTDQATDDNYVVSIPLTGLGLTDFDVSLTEESGSSLLTGAVEGASLIVPEPTSLYYALTGILFLCGFSLLRRKFQFALTHTALACNLVKTIPSS